MVLFGLGAEYLGMSLGVSIITGINVCLGAVLPILFLSRDQFTVKAGLVLAAALAVMVAGVAVISRAGILREHERGAGIKGGRAQGALQNWAAHLHCGRDLLPLHELRGLLSGSQSPRR